jgi:hypothetical protein
MDCEPGQWPTEDRRGCFDLAANNLQYMRWNSWFAIVPTALAALGIVATLLVTLIYTMFVFREKYTIKIL